MGFKTVGNIWIPNDYWNCLVIICFNNSGTSAYLSLWDFTSSHALKLHAIYILRASHLLIIDCL